MRSLIQHLFDLLPADLWKGAMLGAVVSSAFAVSFKVLQRLARLAPIRRLLQGLADPDRSVGVYTRGMFTPSNSFQSKEPQYLPTGPTQIVVRNWINIPEVIGAADVRAASDVVGLLGALGKSAKVNYRSLEHDWDNWTEDIVSVGGHYKTERLLALGLPALVSLPTPDMFRTVPDKRDFQARGLNDYGLIYCGRHPSTNASFLILMGLGAVGTEAAAHVLRSRVSALAALFPGSGFAVIVHTTALDGPQAGRPVWWWPKPTPNRRLAHPIKWHQWCKWAASP